MRGTRSRSIRVEVASLFAQTKCGKPGGNSESHDVFDLDCSGGRKPLNFQQAMRAGILAMAFRHSHQAPKGCTCVQQSAPDGKPSGLGGARSGYVCQRPQAAPFRHRSNGLGRRKSMPQHAVRFWGACPPPQAMRGHPGKKRRPGANLPGARELRGRPEVRSNAGRADSDERQDPNRDATSRSIRNRLPTGIQRGRSISNCADARIGVMKFASKYRRYLPVIGRCSW